MNRLGILVLLVLGLAVSARGQTTAVTATVTDPSGKPYQGCKVNVSYVPSPTATTVPTINGSTFNTTVPIVQCDSFGNFSTTLIDNTLISDGHTGSVGSMWAFFVQSASVCFAGQTVGFNVSLTISGVSENISAQLHAAAATLPTCGGGGGGTAPILETNGVTNITQTLLNLKNGSNVTISADGVGGVTFNSTNTTTLPGGISGDLQFNNASAFGGAAGITTPDGNSLLIKGIDPYADITAFGAIAGLPGSTIRDTATCTRSSTSITMAHGFFLNGYGMTIYGCGATETMGTISLAHGPTPVLAVAGTSPYQTGINGYVDPVSPPNGSSTYKYAVFGRDIYGGLTPASAAVTITTGPTALGLTNLTLSACSLSGTTISCTTTGTQALGVGAEVHLSGSTNALLSGWFNIATVNNAGNAFTITATGVDSRILGSVSSTGGSVSYYTGIYVDFSQGSTLSSAYYVCAQRPGDGALHVIGETGPSFQDGSAYPNASFYDWGPTIQGNNSFDSDYITDADCTSASGLNDPLTTTVVSGGGTTNIVVANAASQNASGEVSVFDDAPAILAAANTCSYGSPAVTGCTVYIPPVPAFGGRLGYIVNSYLKLPSGISIKQAGELYLNETMELPTSYQWEGDWNAGCSGAFAFGTAACVVVGTANPGVFSHGANSSVARDLSVVSNGTNGGILWVADDPYQLDFEHVTFTTNQAGNGDYCGLGLMLRSSSGGGNPIHESSIAFAGGPSQVTDSSWCPMLYLPGINSSSGPGTTGANWFIDIGRIFLNRRGIQQDTYAGPGSRWTLHWMYRQGGITPLFTFNNGNGTINQYLTVDFAEQDTETSSTAAFLGGSTGSFLPFVTFTNIFNGSSEAGGAPPTLTGIAPSMVVDIAGGYNSLYKNTIATDQLGLHANLIQAYPSTFAVLPNCNLEGWLAEVTDSSTATPGATITGGGSNKVLARCDGSNWSVANGSNGSCTPPATNGVYQYLYNVTASAAVPLTCPQVGLTVDESAGSAVTYSDNNNIIYTPASAVSLPTPTTLVNPSFYTNFLMHSAVATVTPATWTISLNGGAASSSAALYAHSKCSVVIDQGASNQWDADCVPLTGYTNTTATNCSAAGSAASPSLVACSAAAAGAFSCATNASTATCVVSTTAVTANSDILIQPSAAAGSRLSVTCNTTADTGLTAPRLASISAGTSFTINLGTFSTNPECFNFYILN